MTTIKMNGEIRDYADYDRLLDELHEKVVLKTRNLDPSRKEFKGIAEPIGIGQIIHHIDSIEADTFKWDKNLPDQVARSITFLNVVSAIFRSIRFTSRR